MSWTNPPTPKAQFSKYELWNYFRFFSVFSYIFPSISTIFFIKWNYWCPYLIHSSKNVLISKIIGTIKNINHPVVPNPASKWWFIHCSGTIFSWYISFDPKLLLAGDSHSLLWRIFLSLRLLWPKAAQNTCLLAIHSLCFGAFSSSFIFFGPKLPKTLAGWRFTFIALAHFPLVSPSLTQRQ